MVEFNLLQYIMFDSVKVMYVDGSEQILMVLMSSDIKVDYILDKVVLVS